MIDEVVVLIDGDVFFTCVVVVLIVCVIVLINLIDGAVALICCLFDRGCCGYDRSIVLWLL